jgi:hypothetical protein
MKFAAPALFAAVLAAPLAAQTAAPAPAQPAAPIILPTTPQIFTGAVVYGPTGAPVGTVKQIVNGIATLDTGEHQAPLPLSAFGQGASGPTITVTREQLNALVEQQLAVLAARRDAALIAGATVLTSDNQPLGTVEQIVGNDVVVARAAPARRVTLGRDYFTADDAGLKARLTLQEIDTAVAQAAGAATAPTTPSQ